MLLLFCSGPGSKCLDDPPRLSVPRLNSTNMAWKLPGVLFDGDTQCKFIYGEQYRQCAHDKASWIKVYFTQLDQLLFCCFVESFNKRSQLNNIIVELLHS